MCRCILFVQCFLFFVHFRRFVLSLLLFFVWLTASLVIFTLSLHDALPILYRAAYEAGCKGCTTYRPNAVTGAVLEAAPAPVPDRKSTRLNSSHLVISYAVFCLNKKENNTAQTIFTAKVHSRTYVPSTRCQQ